MATTQGGGDPYPTVDGEEEPFALSLLRSSCDACWKKKCKCSGELPCQRCERSGGNCQYSTKRRLGRPRGAATKLEGGGAGKRKTTALFDGGNDSALAKAPFAAAPVTGLGGLPESRFLSAFFEHFTPMFPVADEVSIRDGLMHSFAGMWHGGAPTLHGQEASRGRTLECAFLSSVAIGGLLSGQPPEAMASHVESAQASAASCRGLSDKHASSALVLSGMMNLLLPGERSSAAGRRCLDEAEAIFEALPEREPLVAAILTFRRQVESLALIDAATLCPPPRSPPTSSSDGSASATAAAGGGSSRKPPRKVVAPPRASPSSPEAGGAGASGGHVSSSGGGEGLAVAAASASAAAAGDGEAHTDEGRSILAGVDVVRRDSKCAPLTAQPAHPSFVVADALLLTVRFMRGGGTGGISQLRHVHDFVASELNRLVPARAGALVLISLAGTLVAIKTRLQLTDGMLPMAELTTAMLTKCPGWGRSYGRHAAHLALAVFRLHGHRHSYDTLSDLVRKTSDDPIPSFDDSGGGCGHACGLGACRVLSESLSALPLPGTGDDAARGGTGGGTVSSSGSRKSSRKRPAELRPPSSPGGGGGGNADAKRQKRASSSLKSVSASARKRPAEVSAAKPASSTKPDAAVTAIAGEVASAGKLPPSRKSDAATSTPPAASAAISSSATYSSSGVPSCRAFPTEAAAAASSPSTADVAAAAAAVASATAFAVAAAGTTGTTAQSSDRPPTSAPSFGDARFEAAAGRGDRMGGGSSGDGSVASSEDASSLGRPAAAAARAWGARPPGEAGGGSFLGGFSGTNFDGAAAAAAGYGGPPAATRNHHLQHNSHLPVAVSGYPSHYAEAATSGRGDPSDSNTPVGLPQLAPRGRGKSHVVSRQGQLEGGLTAGNIGGYEAELGARGTAAAATAAAARLSSSSHPCSSVPALWRSSDASPSCSSSPSGATAAGMITTAVSDGSARAGAATVASAAPRCSKPGSDGNADSSAAGAAGERTVATAAAAAVAAAASAAASANGGATTWTAPGSRAGVPAWFGGGSGAGPITLPSPYGCSSQTDPGDGGGGGHRRSSWPPPPPGGQWPRGPGGSSNSRSSSGIDGGSGGDLVGGASNGGGGGGGGGGRGAKVASVAHASGTPSFRSGGSEGSVGGGSGGGAQPRRATGRRGNELDFVWELGMLLDEDDAPGDVGRA